MKKILLLIFLGCCFFNFKAQKNTPTFQSNSDFPFHEFLSGVKFAEILSTPKLEQFLKDHYEAGFVYYGVASYLKAMGFEDPGFSNNFLNFTPPSICEKTKISLDYDLITKGYKNYIINFIITFSSCTNNSWTFKCKDPIVLDEGDNLQSIKEALIKQYNLRKPKFNSNNTIKLTPELSIYTESLIKSQFDLFGSEKFEGVYENMEKPQIKLAIIKDKSAYVGIYLSGAANYLDWHEGEFIAKLSPTATDGLFTGEWYLQNKTKQSGYYISFDSGRLNLLNPDKSKLVYLKLYPLIQNVQQPKVQSASATGFAISKEGYLATNFHVIDNAKSIGVRGINEDFSKSYAAKIIMQDRNNDLAILKIDDPAFTGFENIPYIIQNKSSDVGTAVFVLGYPLRAAMGEEVKLTNGIISSKTGFKGDVTAYQISAPIQPGNSGGALFDDNGNVIGVVNAKYLNAENVSYAIKSNYLFNLIETVPQNLHLQIKNDLENKSLSDKVKQIKKFTYIIEVNL